MVGNDDFINDDAFFVNIKSNGLDCEIILPKSIVEEIQKIMINLKKVCEYPLNTFILIAFEDCLNKYDFENIDFTKNYCDIKEVVK